ARSLLPGGSGRPAMQLLTHRAGAARHSVQDDDRPHVERVLAAELHHGCCGGQRLVRRNARCERAHRLPSLICVEGSLESYLQTRARIRPVDFPNAARTTYPPAMKTRKALALALGSAVAALGAACGSDEAQSSSTADAAGGSAGKGADGGTAARGGSVATGGGVGSGGTSSGGSSGKSGAGGSGGTSTGGSAGRSGAGGVGGRGGRRVE